MIASVQHEDIFRYTGGVEGNFLLLRRVRSFFRFLRRTDLRIIRSWFCPDLTVSQLRCVARIVADLNRLTYVNDGVRPEDFRCIFFRSGLVARTNIIRKFRSSVQRVQPGDRFIVRAQACEGNIELLRPARARWWQRVVSWVRELTFAPRERIKLERLARWDCFGLSMVQATHIIAMLCDCCSLRIDESWTDHFGDIIFTTKRGNSTSPAIGPW